MACSSGGRPARRRVGRALHQPEECATSLFHQTRDTTQLAERLRNSKIFVLLIGDKTRYLQKFVRWEIEQAISRGMPIIAVNLNGKRSKDAERCPPALGDALSVHVSFNPAIMQHALESWPASDDAYRREGKGGPYYYLDTVYKKLGL
jgi:hypothetical protein